MISLIISRVGQAILSLFVLATITFFLVRAMPGSPYTSEKAVPAHIRAQLELQAGLNKPVYVQYGLYLTNLIVHQEMGPVLKKDGVKVSEIIAESFPVSLGLGLISIGIALAVGIPIGVLAAVKKNTLVDYGSVGIAMVGICLPSFVIGPIFAVTGGLVLKWFNVAGWSSPTDWVLPAVTLGLINGAYLVRITRGGMLDVLNQDYIRTARAKGASPLRIVIHHTLRGGLIPVVAFIGPAFAGMISGSFVIETIFQIPGMGQYFVNSVGDREFFLIQGLVLFYGIIIFGANLVADLALIGLNPRLRKS